MIISDDDYFNSPLNSPVSGAGLIIIFKILQRLSSRRSASAQFLGRSFVATTTFAKRMPRFQRVVAGSTAEETVTARGGHSLVFEQDERMDLLRAAQPFLTWSTMVSGAETLTTLPYHEFVKLIGCVMYVKGLGWPGRSFRVCIIDAPALDRSWRVILVGITDWSPCKPGAFETRVRLAATNSLASGGQLEVLDTDFYTVPTFSDGPPLADLVWSKHLTFSPGALADTSDGTLGAWADMEYYSESRIGAAGHSPDSALVAFLRQGYEGAIGAMVAAGATTTFVSQLRPSSKAGLVAQHLALLPLPAPLRTFTPPGVPREVESIARVAYLASAGLGAAAERVVIPLLETALEWDDWAVVKAA